MIIRRVVVTPVTVLLLGLAVSCPKTASPPASPTPQPQSLSKPTVDFFSAEPLTIASGQSAALRWSVKDAARVQIDNGIGEVESSGTRQVQPTATATYRLQATNSAGTTVALATISTGRQAAGDAKTRKPPIEESADILATQLQDIHFNYNKEEILESEKGIFEKDTSVLRSLIAADPSVVVIIEGHCDERGSSEYNLALGDRRATFVKDTFVHAGLPADRLNTVSYGKEQPVCLLPTEECLARNRRVHFTPSR